MASLYNGNVMKSIVTISSACALAFAGMASAQDAPAPAPAAETPAAPVAPAAEVSKEAKEAADQMLALMKEMSATLSTVKDKATADAAAEKMAKINEKGEALSKSAQKVQAEMDAAMQARQAELLPIFMGMMTDMQRLQQADDIPRQIDAVPVHGAVPLSLVWWCIRCGATPAKDQRCRPGCLPHLSAKRPSRRPCRRRSSRSG